MKAVSTRPRSASLAEQILARLRDGIAALDPAVRARLRVRVRELHAPEGGVRGLDGRPDLYFSGFGFELAAVLGIPPRPEDLAWIEQARPPEGDGVHLLSLLRCRRALGRRPLVTAGMNATFAEITVPTAVTPYGRFLALLAADLTGPETVGANMDVSLVSGRVEVSPLSLAPTLAAALVVARRVGDQRAAAACAEPLAALRHPAGGWRLAAGLPDADLLATAVTAFALDDAGRRPADGIERDLRFVMAHLCADGGFAQRPGLRSSDIESSWYAVLAIGALAGHTSETVR